MGGNTLHDELDTILVKVASRCNINCSYCYVFNMGDDNFLHQEKIMSQETMLAICSALGVLKSQQNKIFSVVLHGGEPLLLGRANLKIFLSSLREVLSFDYPVSIQTNGILISAALLDICSIYHVSIAVSIDGPKHVHDKDRITHLGKGTFEAVVKGYEILRTHQDSHFLNAGLLAVVDPFSDPEEVYSFFKSTGAPSVDFLYKDGNHNRLPAGKKCFDSTEYGEWMSKLLQIYLSDPSPLPIRVLDDMLKVLLGGMVSKEGLGLNNFGILVIDTDGTLMKNDTLKSVYNGADKFENKINIRHVDLNGFISSAEFRNYRDMQRPTSQICLRCPILNVCGGGMLLHRWKDGGGYNNTSIYCSDQLLLINNMVAAIKKLIHHEA